MVVRPPPRHQPEAPGGKGRRQGLCVAEHLVLVALKLLRGRLPKDDGAGGDHRDDRGALEARPHRFVDGPSTLGSAEDQAIASRAPKCLVGRAGDEVGSGEGRRVEPRRDEPGRVRDVGQDIGARFPGNLSEGRKVDGAGIIARPGDDQPRPLALGQRPHGLLVDPLRRPEACCGFPWRRWPTARSIPSTLSPGLSTARYTARFAMVADRGCMLAWFAPKSFLARSAASAST